MIKDGKINMDWNDTILAESVLTFEGQIKHKPTADLIEGKR
jgi:NAD(P) transhydrogenase subunit alpha